MPKRALVIDGEAGADVVRSLEDDGWVVARTLSEREGANTYAARDLDARELSAAAVGASDEIGGIDLLAWCAPLAFCGGDDVLLDIDEEMWDAASARGARGAFLALKYALPYLVGEAGARFDIYLPSEGTPLSAAEETACAALRAFAERARQELAEHGVEVSIIHGRGA